ncbi:MAG TPA: chromosomal replication initiator protein DnaA [Candidatus Jorgensenbacteria bacterium]|nr:chromosomal replication initiator protein DnaA [Candidatus Jorgensenbacteria bacterium]
MQKTNLNTKDAWSAVLGEIETQISRPNFLTWLKQSELLKTDDKSGVATVSLPNNFAREWVKNRYHKLILGSLRNLDGSIKKINYVVVSSSQPVSLKKQKNVFKPSSSLIDTQTDPKTNLNPRYKLDSYVVGQSNELAHAAAHAVIKHVGKRYNPLFIYGKVGLGKTHLIQAIGNEITKTYNNNVHVLYVTSEKFINDVVWAIRNRRMEDTKKKYRNIDVLIIDDIQFIGGKTATEQEFFHTFNALYEQNKQIILSSDRPPAAIPTLEERLRSRFEGGMVADISYPDYETRLAILKNKVVANAWNVEEKILETIATKVQNNIRELEGVINRVMFYQEFKNEKINDKRLEKIIGETTLPSSKKISADFVINTVAEFFELSVADLTKRSRKREIVEPRQICMYILRDTLKLSYPHIGEQLGKRDHTTAIHACEKITKAINNDSGLNQKVMLIKERLYK